MSPSNIEKQELENLKARVISAIEQGHIKIEDLVSVTSNKDVQDATDILHSLFCMKQHSSDEEKDCQYYDEHILDTCWSRPIHKKWAEVIKLYREIYGTDAVDFKHEAHFLKDVLQGSWANRPRSKVIVALYFMIFYVHEDKKFLRFAEEFMETIK